MKILYVCKTLPYAFKGGIQTHVWKLSEQMLKRGHEVHILTSGSWKKGLQETMLGGRNVISLPYFPGRHLPKIGAFAEEWSFNQAAAKWMFTHQKEFHIIHLQGRSGNLFLRNPEKIDIPIINTLHGFTGIEQERRGSKSKLSFIRKKHIQWAHQMEEYTLKNADKLITVSEEMKRALLERRADSTHKTCIIPNGIDSVENHSTPNTNPNQLVFVGRLDAIKGIFPLVEAMKSVKSEIELVMIGEGAARDSLEKAIAAVNLQDRIHLLGSLNEQQVFKHIRESYALILPSFHETQGIVLMEANSCAKPVLASNINGINEVVVNSKNGLLFPKNNPQEMAKTIDFLFQNPDLATRMGKWGKTHVEKNFSWEGIAERTEKVYTECLKKTKNRTSKHAAHV